MRIRSEWRTLFSPRVLAIARSYLEYDSINRIPTNIMKNGDTYMSMVDGKYYQNIILKDGKVRHSSCTCFYGEKGHCAHEAALLYILEKKDKENRRTRIDEIPSSLMEELENAALEGDKKSIERLSKQVLDLNPYFDEFLLSPLSLEKQLEKVSEEIEDLLKRIHPENDKKNIYDKDKYLECSVKATEDLHLFLLLILPHLVDEGVSSEYIFALLLRTEDGIPEAGGNLEYEKELSKVTGFMKKYLQTFYEGIRDEQKKDIIYIAKEKRTRLAVWLLLSVAKDKEFMQDHIELSSILERGEVREDDVLVMKELGLGDEYLSFILHRYAFRPEVRNLARRYITDSQEKTTFFEVEYEKRHIWQVLYPELYEIYQEVGCHKKACEILFEVIRRKRQHDLSKNDDLKAGCSKDEWERYCTGIRSLESCKDIMPSFLFKYGSPEELMEWLEERDYRKFLDYREYLEPIYPERSLKLYEKLLSKVELGIRSDKGIEYYFKVLNLIKNMEGGEMKAHEILEKVLLREEANPLLKEALRALNSQ